MKKNNQHNNDFDRLTFESYAQRASDVNLSKYEKVGFPDYYRENREALIFQDIYQKLRLDRESITVLDIGCGCSDLVHLTINNAIEKKQKLILNDSKEMLSQIKSKDGYKRIPGRFPNDCLELFDSYTNSIDTILAYSVLQPILFESNPFSFIDKALGLLKNTGLMLIGDLSNINKRNRFFNSERGLKHHQDFTNNDGTSPPQIQFPNSFEKIDDGLIFGILQRYRGLGFETYLLPQNENLPMANRREDILIFRN